MIIHIVEKGETLTQIATRYGVGINNLTADNGISAEDSLVIGQALVILVPDIIHSVRRGETLTTIAKSYGTTAIQLLRNNFRLGGKPTLTTG